MSHWCQSHPKYEAKREPNSLCGECWRLWFFKNPELKSSSRALEPTDFAALDVVTEGS